MSLTGVWVNEHRSIMVIAEDFNGGLAGTYRSLVGRDTRKRPLSGRTTPEEAGKQLLGFTVCFQIEEPGEATGHNSVCTWSGWTRRKQITTTWLLTTSFLDPKDEWSSTRVGHDTFEKVFETAKAEYLDADEETLNRLLVDARK